ncbi:arsenate reductase family protein [Pyramidobacter sp. YE332]|nr:MULTISPECIES: arsenate reductase family protein [unclassified Pyramidobacter]OON87855.1 ArsC family transcriptional regulator [Pyramidobacter sp. C12-8]RKJ77063.1 arsenate reductase family protein [Pyramidobacter sp. CG50-2]WOL39513.1 arsenate reductase family protein [Pyramidobacter sp. YE332]
MNLFLCYDRCSTCKKAEQWLKDNGVSYEKRPIVDARPTVAELRAWHEKSGLPVRRFFNTSGILYRSLNVKDRLPGMSDEEAYELLATDGMLVKRPLLVTPEAVLPGFKEADWAKALKKQRL